jgi:hypothetical protein
MTSAPPPISLGSNIAEISGEFWGKGQEGRAPDLIVPGAQKGGTTWVHHVLAAHPDCWMPPFKELDFFTNPRSNLSWKLRGFQGQMAVELQRGTAELEMLRWYSELCLTERMDLRWYRRLFRFAGKRLCADVSPNYSRLDLAGVVRVAKACPDARILLILRDPFDRMVSELRMLARAGQVEANLDGPRTARLITSPEHLSFGDYAGILSRWESQFGTERVKIRFYEDLQHDPEAFLVGLCSDLAIRPPTPPLLQRAHERFNESPPGQLPETLQKSLANSLLPLVTPLRARFPERFESWMVNLRRALRGGMAT